MQRFNACTYFFIFLDSKSDFHQISDLFKAVNCQNKVPDPMVMNPVSVKVIFLCD